MTLIAGIYLILGGYFAVTLTDMIQGVIMLFGSVAMIAVLVTTGFALVVVVAAYFAGSMTHIFFTALPNAPNPYDVLVPDMLKANLPEYLMGIILLLVLSASMSTLSSLVMVSSSAVTIDFYKGHINTNASHRHYVTLMRVMSGVFIVASC